MDHTQNVFVKVFTSNVSTGSALGRKKGGRKRVPVLRQVYDHKPVLLAKGKTLNLACCDCGLTHQVTVEGPVNGKYKLNFYRDDTMSRRVRCARAFPMFMISKKFGTSSPTNEEGA